MESEFKRAAVGEAGGNEIVVCSGKVLVVDLDGHAVRIEGQTCAHLIVQDIGDRVAVRNGDGGLKLDGVADVGVVGLAVDTVFFDFLINSRLAVLFLDGHVRHGGIQRAQRAQIGLNQIVAKRQVCKFDNAACGLLLAIVSNTICCSVRNRSCGKVSGICAVFPCHIAHVINRDIVQACCSGYEEVCPFCADLVVDCRVVCVVAVQIENAVQGVGFVDNRIIDLNATVGVNCECRNAQRQHEHNGQQQSQGSFDVFHLFLFFLSCFLFFMILINRNAVCPPYGLSGHPSSF